jgi:hypothetical protein
MFDIWFPTNRLVSKPIEDSDRESVLLPPSRIQTYNLSMGVRITVHTA